MVHAVRMLRPSGPRRDDLALVIPVVAFVIAAQQGRAGELTGSWLLTGAGLCFAAGVAWQYVDRRDVADRLTLFACFFIVGVLTFGALAGGDVVEMSSRFLTAVLAMVSGCVIGEQMLRSGDVRRARRIVAASPEQRQRV